MDSEARTRLKVAIAQSGRKANEISTSQNWPETYVSRVVSGGIKSPDPSRLLAICEAVGVDITYVLKGERTTPNRQALIDEISNSPQQVIDQVANFVREIGLDSEK